MKRQNFSSQRQAIYKAICSTKTHPSAKWVYENLKKSYPNLSLGTVYRNVALFKERGQIISVTNINGEERIDGNITPHSHFVCKNCGCIYDIFDDSIANINCPLSDEGFKVESSSVNFYGICNNCNQKG